MQISAKKFADWRRKAMECEACGLCARRLRVVLGEGILPAAIFIVGEAPGLSEDALGTPFVGPSGQLLREVLRRVKRRIPWVTWYITNTVCCIPREDTGVRPPAQDEIVACHPRLASQARWSEAKLGLAIGRIAEIECNRWWTGVMGVTPLLSVLHPAAALRSGKQDNWIKTTTEAVCFCLTGGTPSSPRVS